MSESLKQLSEETNNEFEIIGRCNNIKEGNIILEQTNESILVLTGNKLHGLQDGIELCKLHPNHHYIYFSHTHNISDTIKNVRERFSPLYLYHVHEIKQDEPYKLVNYNIPITKRAIKRFLAFKESACKNK